MSSGAGVAYLDDYVTEQDYFTEVAPATVLADYSPWFEEFASARARSFAEQPSVVRSRERQQTILGDVIALHSAAEFIAASDTLLTYVVELLDDGDFRSLDSLVVALTDVLQDEPGTCDDRGLARIHNVLALTTRHDQLLPGRAQLRSQYRACVAEREGQAAADAAVALL